MRLHFAIIDNDNIDIVDPRSGEGVTVSRCGFDPVDVSFRGAPTTTQIRILRTLSKVPDAHFLGVLTYAIENGARQCILHGGSYRFVSAAQKKYASFRAVVDGEVVHEKLKVASEDEELATRSLIRKATQLLIDEPEASESVTAWFTSGRAVENTDGGELPEFITYQELFEAAGVNVPKTETKPDTEKKVKMPSKPKEAKARTSRKK